jgi:hypothetical protein
MDLFDKKEKEGMGRSPSLITLELWNQLPAVQTLEVSSLTFKRALGAPEGDDHTVADFSPTPPSRVVKQLTLEALDAVVVDLPDESRQELVDVAFTFLVNAAKVRKLLFRHDDPP